MNCRAASNKAFRQLGIPRRAFGRFEPGFFGISTTLYIRPHLEYAAQVCRPWLVKDQRLLERPQRWASKYVRGLWNTPYLHRLKILEGPSMRHHGLRGDLILVHAILHVDVHPLFRTAYVGCSEKPRGTPVQASTSIQSCELQEKLPLYSSVRQLEQLA